jgi:hypothetical protein
VSRGWFTCNELLALKQIMERHVDVSSKKLLADMMSLTAVNAELLRRSDNKKKRKKTRLMTKS